jgi:hypothetical protein
MEAHGFKINLGDVAQVLLAAAAVISAWYGRKKSITQKDNEDEKTDSK